MKESKGHLEAQALWLSSPCGAGFFDVKSLRKQHVQQNVRINTFFCSIHFMPVGGPNQTPRPARVASSASLRPPSSSLRMGARLWRARRGRPVAGGWRPVVSPVPGGGRQRSDGTDGRTGSREDWNQKPEECRTLMSSPIMNTVRLAYGFSISERVRFM